MDPGSDPPFQAAVLELRSLCLLRSRPPSVPFVPPVRAAVLHIDVGAGEVIGDAAADIAPVRQVLHVHVMEHGSRGTVAAVLVHEHGLGLVDETRVRRRVAAERDLGRGSEAAAVKEVVMVGGGGAAKGCLG